MDTSLDVALRTMLHQMLSSPASLYVIIGISVVAYMLESWPNFDNRAIKIVCILLGPSTYWLFATKGSVPSGFDYPPAVLAVNGLVCGLFAALGHTFVTRNVMEWMQGRRERDNQQKNPDKQDPDKQDQQDNNKQP